MKTRTHLGKRALSLVLSVLMVVTMLPTFVFSSPTTAEAKDAPKAAADDYWQILASTDFTGTNWTRNDNYNWYTNTSPTTSAGGNPMGWSVQFRDNEPEVTKDNGVKFWYNSGSDHNQGVMYMSSYNSQTSNGFFTAAANGGTAVTSFKIDLKFNLFGQTKANSGYDLSSRRGENVFFKLCENDSKYNFESRYSYNYVYYAQESYGRRHMKGNSDIYAAPDTQDGGNYVLSTDKSYIDANADYHYIIYVADGWLCSYVTDASGNVVIDYAPIDVSNYSLAPADITGLFLNGSEFNFMGYEDFENVTYKSIEIYKGAETVTTDTSKSKYLYTYFTGNSTNGELLHYAVSDDGINFKPVNDGLPVWDSNASWSIPQYPTGSTSGVATSKHVRDPYILNKRNTSTGEVSTGYYILATDLNTQNGTNWGNNSKLLVYDVDNLQNIDTTTPWVIDTTDMCASLTGGTVSRAWAPQAIWDNAKGKYMLYWSVGYVGGLTKLYYIYTSDFKTFEGTPQQLIYPTFCNNFIDADITYHNGVYYMYFKDEDAKKVYRAIAPRPNGPYQGFTKFSDTGMEGPQVYELADGSYALMTDVYGEGNYYIYQANNPKGFDASSASTTNVNYLHPRHGSVIRITPAEYTAIVNKFGTLTPNTVEYLWASDTSGSGNEMGYFSVKDPGGHVYDICYGQSYNDGGGYITLNSTNVFINDDTARDIYTGDAYTINFTHKLTDSTKNTADYTAFALGTPLQDYVKLTENGEFYVNGSKAGSFTLSPNVEYDITVTFNGYATCLLVDDTYICGAINTTHMVKENGYLYIALGWSDATGSRASKQTTAQYGKLTVSPTATDIGETAEDALLDTIRPDRAELVDADGNLEFNVQPWHKEDPISSNAYNNIVYSPKNTTSWSGNGAGDVANGVGRIDFKVAMPLNTVLVYDGASGHDPVAPIMLETRCNDTNGSAHKIYYAEIRSSACFSLNQQWNGYTGGDGSAISDAWTKWAGGQTLTATDKFSYSSSVSNTSSDSQRDSNSRFWWNKLIFDTSYFTTHDVYYVVDTNISFNAKTYYKQGWSGNDKSGYFTSVSNNYVLNYKPVYDILKSGTTATKSTNAGNKTALQLYDYLMDENGEAQWMYTTESRINALIALKRLADCNPKNYSYSSGVSSAVSSCASDIEAAVTAWNNINLVKKDFTVTYKMYDGSTSTATVQAGNDIDHKSSGVSIPENTPKAHINGSNYHWAYSWTSSTGVWDGTQTPSGSHVPHSNETYVETRGANAVHCESVGDPIADDPGLTYDESTDTYSCATGWTHHNGATTDDNGYCTSYCTVCNGSEKVWDKHDDEWEEYCDYVDMVEDSGEYTTSSRAEYNTQIASTISGVTEYDETKSASYITTKNTALATAASTYLNPLAEYNLIADELDDRSAEKATNNYDGTTQLNTYTSWMNFVELYNAGDDLLNHTYSEGEKAEQGKFTVTGNVVNNGNHGTTETTSTYQDDIVDAVDALDGATLVSITDTSSFATYNTSRDVSRGTLDKGNYDSSSGTYLYDGKYTEAAINYVEGAITTADGNVYHKLTAEDYEAYNTSTGKSFAVGTEIKNTADADTYTGNVLTAVSDINNDANKATYINQFSVRFMVQTEKNATLSDTTTTKYYGEPIELTVPAAALTGRTLSLWSTSIYGGTNGNASENPIASQKNYTSGATTLNKIVNANMVVTAEVNDDTSAVDNTTRFNIYDAYKNLIDVRYLGGDVLVSEGTDRDQTITLVTGNTVTAKTLPLYDFDYWQITKLGDAEYKLVPCYTPADSFTITADSVSLGSKQYDQRVYLTTSTANFWAWAVEKDGKLDIASYSKDYSFFACAAEDYVVLVNDNGTIKKKGGDAVTASDLNCTFTSTGSQTADEFAQSMLLARAPFISIETESHSANQVRVYCRVTEGATGTEGFGVLFRKDDVTGTADNMAIGVSGVNKRAITSALDSGQFSYTLNNSKGFSSGYKIPFRGFVNYKFSYTAGGTTYNNFNGTAYSAVKNVTI